MYVVAGPPGSGKSEGFALVEFGVDFFNIDDVCASRNPTGYVGISPELRKIVGAECRSFILDHIALKRSFAVETTLRTTVSIEQAALARSNGFQTVMIFITCSSVEEHIRRVKKRAQEGGHSAPEDEIRSTYAASLRNLRHAIKTFERVVVRESEHFQTRLVAIAHDGATKFVGLRVPWLQQVLLAET